MGNQCSSEKAATTVEKAKEDLESKPPASRKQSDAGQSEAGSTAAPAEAVKEETVAEAVVEATTTTEEAPAKTEEVTEAES